MLWREGKGKRKENGGVRLKKGLLVYGVYVSLRCGEHLQICSKTPKLGKLRAVNITSSTKRLKVRNAKPQWMPDYSSCVHVSLHPIGMKMIVYCNGPPPGAQPLTPTPTPTPTPNMHGHALVAQPCRFLTYIAIIFPSPSLFFENMVLNYVDFLLNNNEFSTRVGDALFRRSSSHCTKFKGGPC